METNKKNRSSFKKALSVILMGSVCLTAALTVGSMTKKVTVTDGNETVTISTLNPDTESVLSKSGLQLGENDKLVRTEDEGNGVNISIIRALDVESSDPGKNTGFNESSVADSLLSAGMTLSDNESISLAAALENSGSETEVKLSRHEITVDVRGKSVTKYVPAGTVKNALEFLDVKLGTSDVVDVDLEKEVEDGMKIVVKKVEYKTKTEVETIDYETVYKDSDELFVGDSKVQTEGQEGERTIVTKETFVNGRIDSTETVSNKVTKEPVDKVVLNGTKEQPVEEPEEDNRGGEATVDEGSQTLIDSSGRAVSYSYVLNGTGTAYTGDGCTSTGRTPRVGVVAVNPNVIPYGSILYIVSDDGAYDYGYCVAGDTGGAMMDGYVLCDLYMNSEWECDNFGRRGITVYVLDGVSEDMTY